MRTVPRQRQYVGRSTLLVLRPVLRYSAGREAYVIRGIGRRLGPVLREDRRRQQTPLSIPDRRRGSTPQSTLARAQSRAGKGPGQSDGAPAAVPATKPVAIQADVARKRAQATDPVTSEAAADSIAERDAANVASYFDRLAARDWRPPDA
jgi:hypothetical protein